MEHETSGNIALWFTGTCLSLYHDKLTAHGELGHTNINTHTHHLLENQILIVHNAQLNMMLMETSFLYSNVTVTYLYEGKFQVNHDKVNTHFYLTAAEKTILMALADIKNITIALPIA